MSTIFTKIINREIPASIVAEDDHHIAFLDINPLVRGHVLVVPKREEDYIFNLDDEELAALHVFAKPIAHAIEKAFPCIRVGVAVIGLEVPHVHVHLVPLNRMGDINFENEKLKLTSEQLEEDMNKIKAHL